MLAAVALSSTGMIDGSVASDEPFDVGKTIIEHIANNAENPIIRLPEIFGIDFSITKHVLMIWLVAIIAFVCVTWIVRRYLRADTVPSKLGAGLEMLVSYICDSIVLPNVGPRWVNTWADRKSVV